MNEIVKKFLLEKSLCLEYYIPKNVIFLDIPKNLKYNGY